MINKKIFFILILTTTIFCIGKVGTAVYRWAEIETGTRAVAMAGSQVASGNGVYAIPYNPASLGFVGNNTEIYVSKASYLAGTSHNTIAFGTGDGSDFFGAHLYYFDSGEMQETTEIDGGITGQGFKFTGFVARLTYTKQLTDRLKLGGTFKYFNEQTTSADLSMSSVAFDIGSNFDTGISGMTLGMCISNLGPDARYEGVGLDVPGEDDQQNKTEYFPIPLTFRVGLMNNIMGPDPEMSAIHNPNHRLTVSMDAINPLDYDLGGSLGMEYSWNETVFVRGGYHLNHDTAGLAAGFGVLYNGIALDFGWADYAILENTWQLGLSFTY